MNIQLAPTTPGATFTATEWTAEVDHCGTNHPWRYRNLECRADTRADALAAIKREARRLGYRGKFTSYVDAWRHF